MRERPLGCSSFSAPTFESGQKNNKKKARRPSCIAGRLKGACPLLTMTTATAGEKTRARRTGVAGSEEPNGRLLAAEGSRPLSSSSSSRLPRQ